LKPKRWGSPAGSRRKIPGKKARDDDDDDDDDDDNNKFEETIYHIISACPIFTKEQYIKKT
jgi:hypothetical protein